MFDKIVKYTKIAINLAVLAFGIGYIIFNFQAMFPTVAAIAIIAGCFVIFGGNSKPKKD